MSEADVSVRVGSSALAAIREASPSCLDPELTALAVAVVREVTEFSNCRQLHFWAAAHPWKTVPASSSVAAVPQDSTSLYLTVSLGSNPVPAASFLVAIDPVVSLTSVAVAPTAVR